MLNVSPPHHEVEYLSITDLDAWFIARRLIGKTDPLEGAPISRWLAIVLADRDVRTREGYEYLSALIGGQGLQKVFRQDASASEPTITPRDPQTYARDYINRARRDLLLEAPDLDLAGSYRDVLISLYDAHKLGGASAARTAWDTVKRLRPEAAALDAPKIPAKVKANDLKYLPKPEYLLEAYPIYKGGMNAVVGASGAGKSFVCVDVGASVATSISASQSVIYVALEGLSGFSERWEAWKKHHRQNCENFIFYTLAVNFTHHDPVSAFIEDIRVDNPVLLIVDTVARSMTGSDENSTKEMGEYIAFVDLVMRELDCAVLLVHHTNKGGKMRGNNSLYNACDSVLFLARREDHLVLHNRWDEGGKNKYRPEAPSRYLKLLPIEVDVDGTPTQSAVIVPSDKIIVSDDDPLLPSDRAILESLVAFENGLTVAAIIDATEIPRATAYRRVKLLIERKLVQQTTDDHIVITEDGLKLLE